MLVLQTVSWILDAVEMEIRIGATDLRVFRHDELTVCDLIVDAIYEGGTANNVSDDVVSKLLPGTGNRGGFRSAGRGPRKNLVVLYTSGRDPDWPDSFDSTTGRFIYWGDNKRPGHGLHETIRGGNRLLRSVFGAIRESCASRECVPPFFVFHSNPTNRSSWSVRFLGLAVPGCPDTSPSDTLVALWRSTEGQRFQNYRAVFTVLDVPSVPRQWINSLLKRGGDSNAAPEAWRNWVSSGRYLPLISTPTSQIRTADQQKPKEANHRALLRAVYEHYRDRPTAFESFAARLYQLHDSRVVIDEITRPVRDGGRDAIGRYRLGLVTDPVYVEFALEAKCYDPDLDGNRPGSVGVRDVARLIARLRHRQFGVLVTTSIIGKQAYTEVRDDKHPVVIISGRDIVDILLGAGIKTNEQLDDWLSIETSQT